MTQALYRKWRPRRWEEVVGQDHVVSTLKNAVSNDHVAHAYLFAGPRGTGKTTAARILAKAVNCLETDLTKRPCDQCEHCLAINQGRFLDLIEIDAASNTSVDDVRDLRDKINFSPNQGRYKVYIIDEVHMLSTAAFNAMLKTLEEPPSHAIFVLATTEIHKIPATILSRCQRHEFRRIPVVEIVNHLKMVANNESLHVDDEALTLIARQATGSLRDAISLLDQLASTGNDISIKVAENVLGTATNQAVLDLINTLIAGDTSAGLNCIHRTLDEGSDPRQFARQVVDYARDLMLVRMGIGDQVDVTGEIKTEMAAHARRMEITQLLNLIQLFSRAANESRAAWQPALPLEMAIIEGIDSLNNASIPKSTETRSSSSTPKSQPQKTPEYKPEPVILDTEADSLGNVTEPNSTVTGLTIKQINDQWRQVLKLVGEQSRQTQALLNSCKPYGIKDGCVYLGFNGDFAKSKMEKEGNLEIAQKALSQIMGTNITVRCMVITGQKGDLPPDVDGDGMVATALRDLGGEIVDIQ
jgi:DNA polymerase-3 subunit gamma/tau